MISRNKTFCNQRFLRNSFSDQFPTQLCQSQKRRTVYCFNPTSSNTVRIKKDLVYRLMIRAARRAFYTLTLFLSRPETTSTITREKAPRYGRQMKCKHSLKPARVLNVISVHLELWNEAFSPAWSAFIETESVLLFLSSTSEQKSTKNKLAILFIFF